MVDCLDKNRKSRYDADREIDKLFYEEPIEGPYEPSCCFQWIYEPWIQYFEQEWNLPKSSPHRQVFRFNLELSEFEVGQLPMEFIIPANEVKSVVKDLKHQETMFHGRICKRECAYQCISMFFFCILDCCCQPARIMSILREMNTRQERIQHYLDGVNSRYMEGKGWRWICGRKGAWIELCKEGYEIQIPEDLILASQGKKEYKQPAQTLEMSSYGKSDTLGMKLEKKKTQRKVAKKKKKVKSNTLKEGNTLALDSLIQGASNLPPKVDEKPSYLEQDHPPEPQDAQIEKRDTVVHGQLADDDFYF